MRTLIGSRVPLVVLALLFLIPVGTSSLRGLAHLLTCEDEVGTPFAIQPGLFEGDPPTVTSSRVLEQGVDPLLCDALMIDMAANRWDEDRGALEMEFVIANVSDQPWHGTVHVRIDRQRIPLEAGRIDPGYQVSNTVWVRTGEDRVDIEGTLLIGP